MESTSGDKGKGVAGGPDPAVTEDADLVAALKRLKAVANEIAGGEYSSDIMALTLEPNPVLVRELAEAVGMMMVKVETREFELKLKNEGLEKTVAERTRELAELNANLEQRVKEQAERIVRYGEMEGYLPAQLVQLILAQGDEFSLAHSRTKLTVFFSDIRGFTSLSDSIEPEELATLLNEYLTEMSEIALAHGGTIDKFIGDGIMIFFGAPRLALDRTSAERQAVGREDALACVRMAIAMRERMRELRREWSEQGVEFPLEIRMGINSGYCTVGNFGSPKKLDYTAIGREVNLASRIEGLAPPREILVSHATHGLISEDIDCEFHDKVSNVKGFQRPVQVYRVIGEGGAERTDDSPATDVAEGVELLSNLKNLSSEERTRLRQRLERILDKLR